MSTDTAVQSPAVVQSVTDLITHIVRTHHAFLRSELPFLEERIARMCTNHGQDHPEFFRIQQILQDLRDDLTAHLAKEENVLFPYLTGLESAIANGTEAPHACFPSVQFPIRMMLMEHDRAEELLQGLSATSNRYTAPPELCERGQEFFARLRGLEDDLKAHIRIENEVLFPRAVEME